MNGENGRKSTLFRIVECATTEHTRMLQHVVNILLHALVTIGVRRLLVEMLTVVNSNDEDNTVESTASLAALLFAVHPVHTECVSCLILMEEAFYPAF